MPTPDSEKAKFPNAKTLVVAIAALAMVVIVALSYLLGGKDCFQNWGKIWGVFKKPCGDLPYVAGLLVVLGTWILYQAVSGCASWRDVIKGDDKRLSASKLQFFLWTVVVIFAYASFFAARIAAGKIPPETNLDIPKSLLIAMGLSVTTALGAKGITVSYINSGKLTKDHPEDGATVSNLASDDSGAVDLSKVQMLAWTLIAIVSYLVSVARQIHVGGLNNLPDIDSALMVLTGLGQGTYLGKKLIVNTTPVVANCDPDNGAIGTEITLTGSNFGGVQGNSRITIDGNAFVPVPDVKKWSDTSITFTIPPTTAQLSYRKAQTLGVVVGAQESNSVPFYIRPVVNKLTFDTASNEYTLEGQGFGDQQAGAQLFADDEPAVNPRWSDTAVVFGLSNKPKPLKTTTLRLVADGRNIVYKDTVVT